MIMKTMVELGSSKMNKECENCEYKRMMKRHFDIHFEDDTDCPSIKCDIKDKKLVNRIKRKVKKGKK